MRIITAIAIILMINIAAWAGSDDVGTTAYPFLKVGVSAKSQAMAGAFVGLADDLSSLHCNPAGLTAPVYKFSVYDDYYDDEDDYSDKFASKDYIESRMAKPNKFIATYMDYLLDFQTGYLGYVRNLSELSSFGVSLQYQDYGTFERRASDNSPNGTFSAYDMAFGLTYSKRLNRELSLGATAKFIIEKIDSSSSDAMALDLGGLYRFGGGRTSLGLAAKNIGTQLKGFTKAHKDPLPVMIDFGFSHSLKGMPLIINGDITYPFDNDPFFALGAQLESFRTFFLRLGWSSAGLDYKTGSDKDIFGGFAAGFGYQIEDYMLDYAYSSYADIGNVHRITIAAGF